ncbi:MAG TPA: ABC transporter permease [Pyrinomonadaceae bacterium]|jgi:ABC-type transport system involved in multi-copper enzyme maturation permease subunit
MSSATNVAAVEKKSEGLPWSLWLHQAGAIFRLELRKNLWGKRAILIYMLALFPVLLMAMVAAVNAEDIRTNFSDANEVYSAIYQGLILRTVIFFGCAWMFMNLFRGEVVDRSLHYYFLCPVRREVLVAGKYLSGLVAAIFLFLMTTIGSVFFIYLAGYPSSTQFLMNGPGLGQVFTYMGITVLACIGYGAVFLVIGLFFRNPIVPALVVFGLEAINFLLPPVLKKISVIHYLQSLAPVPMSEGPFAVIAEPTPAWIAIPGLIIFTLVVLVVASIKIRRMEIRYGGE